MNKFTHIKIIFIASLLLIILSSCSSKNKKTPSAEKNYIEAVKKLKNKDYTTAAQDFEKINDEYPLSEWGVKGQQMATYCFYLEKEYDDVIRIVDIFNQNNPSNPNVSYMQYIKSLSYYNQMNNIKRAQNNAIEASLSFRELIARFPYSKYSDDARKKLLFINEHIAGAKMSIGRYQQKNNNYIGAIKNFKEVINRYSKTNQTPEAYFRIFESYKKIGLNNMANHFLQELQLFYPNNQWGTKTINTHQQKGLKKIS